MWTQELGSKNVLWGAGVLEEWKRCVQLEGLEMRLDCPIHFVVGFVNVDISVSQVLQHPHNIPVEELDTFVLKEVEHQDQFPLASIQPVEEHIVTVEIGMQNNH